MSLEQITDFNFEVEGNVLTIFVPNNSTEETWTNGLQENSEYIITISGLTTSTGEVISEKTFEILMPLTPQYCSLTAVMPMVNAFNIPKKDMLLYLRDASLEADFIEGSLSSTSTTTTSSDSVLFAKKQFVKTKVVLDCLVRSLAEGVSSGVGSRYKLDVAEIEENLNASAYKAMIADLRKDLLKWQDAIRGYYNEGRVAPKATRFSINQKLDHTTVDKIIDDISRTMPSRSD